MVKFAHSVQKLARESKTYRVLIPSIVVAISLGMLAFLPKTEFLPAITSPVYSITYALKKTEGDSQKEIMRNSFAQTLSSRDDLAWSIATSSNSKVEILFKLSKVLPKKDVLLIFSKLQIETARLNIQMVGPAGSGERFGYDGLFYISKSIDSERKLELEKQFCSSSIIEYCQNDSFTESLHNKLTPNSMLSAQMGGSSAQVAVELAVPLRKLDLRSVGMLQYPTPIIIELDDEAEVTSLPLSMPSGAITTTGNLLKPSYIKQNENMIRFNSKEYSPLFFRMGKTTLGEVTDYMSHLADSIGIDASQVAGMGGIRTMDESFSSLIEAIIISTIIIFSILAIQFQSWVQALIIMGTIPLTLGGAISGLLIMDETINASVMVGFILLIGIVVNNGIFLVEATNQRLREGNSIADSITMAVAERTRPILMTSLSTIFGMLPTILIGGEGSELYRGMAIVNVFGMVIGTILSIVITPIFIEIFGRNK